MSLVPLPSDLIPFLEDYFPRSKPNRPYVTLSYAQSLDSRIAAKPGVQTVISHAETKTMTHYIRSKHDAILVGIGTVLADDPKLNCRYEGGKSPRPIIIDPKAKWDYFNSLLRQIADNGQGLAPFIIVDEKTPLNQQNVLVLADQGGKYLPLPLTDSSVGNWELILMALNDNGIKSVMVEGGARIINDLLEYHSQAKVVDSLIITIGPVYLSNEGVEVSPSRHVQLDNVKWWTGVRDSVVAATVV